MSAEYDTGYTERNERLYRCRACWYRTADPVDILEHLDVEHDPHSFYIYAAPRATVVDTGNIVTADGGKT